MYSISELTAVVQLKHREHRGLGYDTGYSTLGAFIIPKSESNVLPLADIRAHVFNNGYFASNLGAGCRFITKSDQFAIGLNAFYDFRKWKDLYTSQFAAGFEVLTKIIDLRLNGYYPIGQRYKEKIHSLSADGLTFQTRYALPCVDLELAGRAVTGSNFFQIHVGAGPYYLLKQNAGRFPTGNALGLRANAAFHISKWFTLGGEYTYDRLFKARFVGFLSLNIHLGKKERSPYKEAEKQNIREAFRVPEKEMNVRLQPIRRNEIIPMIRRRHTVSSL
ncbi:MAG: hypothetical protein S4CHLAM37_14060 [Chlamydiia bacterium]|nr:hypothetical protein [Chlamydiia bacterium]